MNELAVPYLSTVPSGNALETGAADSELLSQRLLGMVEEFDSGVAVTLNGLLARTEEQGLYLMVILLSLPFLVPLPTPGLSNLFGTVIVVMMVQGLLGRCPRLSRRIGDRSISPRLLRKVVGLSVRVLAFLERWIRPRGEEWMTWKPVHTANVALLTLMAFVLALPIPPVIPFSNSLPSCAIVLLAASMMESDGIMIWTGYAMSLVTMGYLAVTGNLVVAAMLRFFG